MKWIILLLLLLIVAAFIALRYRRQIQTGLHIYRMFRKMQKASKPVEKKAEQPRVIDKNENLVRCSRCGKWIPESAALNLRSKVSYCSTVCMEKAARIESLIDRS